ncbi:MAG: hypothetical protein AAGA54_00190 [Myxococcota bacterium]
MTLRLLKTLTLAAAVFSIPALAVAAPPGMPDPVKMSGIPRPDPKLDAGTVTVRCLGAAGFTAPFVDHDVDLVVTGTDGKTTKLTAKTQGQGRATFEGVEIGATAVASATLGDGTVSSAPIRLLPQAGTAVMLVEGAAAPAVGARPQPPARPAGPDIPAPGNAFPLDGTEVGTLTIGTFDLDARKPISSVVVKLTITPLEGEPIVRELTTDARGKAIFDKLAGPDVPEGSSLTAEATLVEGGQLRKSEPFTMSADKGMALVLAEGADDFESRPAGQQAAAAEPAARKKLPGPRILRTLPPGNVRITLWDGTDKPLPKQRVMVVKKTAAGGVEKYRGVTQADGSVTIKDIPVQQDALYFVESIYSKAPWQSTFFGMDDRGGVAVEMRLWETTTDRSVVRSAVQYDIEERENDLAQIVQIYEVMVNGDKAFWDPSLEITSMDGAKGFVVLRPAEEFLDHEEKAPFATLHGPIAPGSLTNLSIGYLLDHDGTVEIDWDPPFQLIQSSVLVSERLTLSGKNEQLTDHASPIPGKTVYTVEAGDSLKFTMSGLRSRPKLYKQVGWGGLGAFALLTVFGLMRKRPSKKEQLTAQRERLLAKLEAAGVDSPEAEPMLAELDRVVRQLEVLETPAG